MCLSLSLTTKYISPRVNKQDAVFRGSDCMSLIVMLWLLSECSLSALWVLWLLSDLDRRWRLTALDNFSLDRQTEIVTPWAPVGAKKQRRPEWHCEMFKKRSIKMSFCALKVLSGKYPTSVSISLYFWDWQMLAVIRKYVWGNFYWIFLLLSVPGISLIHWTLDAPAPDTFSFNSLLTSALPRLLCHI